MSFLSDAARFVLSTAGQTLVAAADAFNTDVRQGATPPHYTAAGQGPRFAGLSSSRLSVNTILAGSADTLRSRARALHREESFTRKGLRALKMYSIGTGINVQSKIKDETLRELVHEAWLDWWDECDADGRTDFGGLTSLAVLSMALDGEVFGRIRYRRPEDGYRVPMQIQLLSAALCPLDLTRVLESGNIVRQGIETNGFGQRTAIWLLPFHPGDLQIPGITNQPKAIPIEQMLHVYELLEAGQLRGEPWLASVITTANDLNAFDDATLQKAEIAAALTGVIEPPEADGVTTMQTPGNTPDSAGNVDETIQVGQFRVLKPGEKVETFPAADVGDTYEPFVKHNLRRQAAGMGVPYESMTGDLEAVNYTSSRVGRLDFKRFCDQLLYHVVVPQFCKPIYEAWFDRAVLAGVLPIGVREYNKNRRDYLRARWISPQWEWVDPQKEAEATKTKIRCGLTSRSAEIRALGDDPETVDQEIADDNKRADALDLVLDSDPRAGDGAGAAATPTTQPTDGQDSPPTPAPRRSRNRKGAAA